MNASFNITIDTPIGSQKGVVTFVDENGALSGSIRAMGNTNFFKKGKIVDNSFTFSGILDVGFFKFAYTAKGTIVGNELKAVATTSSGTFQMRGTRV